MSKVVYPLKFLAHRHEQLLALNLQPQLFYQRQVRQLTLDYFWYDEKESALRVRFRYRDQLLDLI